MDDTLYRHHLSSDVRGSGVSKLAEPHVEKLINSD